MLPPACDLIERCRSRAQRVRRVMVALCHVALGRARSKEGNLRRGQFSGDRAPHRHRAAATMPARVAVRIVFDALVEGQHLFPGPVRQAVRRPCLVVSGTAAQREAVVHRRGAADQFAARQRQRGLVRRGQLCVRIAPVVACRHGRAVPKVIRPRIGGRKIGTRLEQGYLPPRVFGQAGSDHTACRTGSDNYNILVHGASCRSSVIKAAISSAEELQVSANSAPVAPAAFGDR